MSLLYYLKNDKTITTYILHQAELWFVILHNHSRNPMLWFLLYPFTDEKTEVLILFIYDGEKEEHSSKSQKTNIISEHKENKHIN